MIALFKFEGHISGSLISPHKDTNLGMGSFNNGSGIGGTGGFAKASSCLRHHIHHSRPNEEEKPKRPVFDLTKKPLKTFCHFFS